MTTGIKNTQRLHEISTDKYFLKLKKKGGKQLTQFVGNSSHWFFKSSPAGGPFPNFRNPTVHFSHGFRFEFVYLPTHPPTQLEQ